MSGTVRHRRPSARELLIASSPVVWPLAATALTLIEAHRLPQRFGGWWTAGGSFVTPPSPWEASPWEASPWGAVAVTALAVVVGVPFCLRVFWLTPDRTQRRITVFTVATLAGLAAIPYLVALLAQAHHWRPPPVPVVILAGFLLAGTVGALPARRVPPVGSWPERPALSAQAPRVRLAGSQRVAWTGGVDRPNYALPAFQVFAVALWVWNLSLQFATGPLVWQVSATLGLAVFTVAEAVVTVLALRLRVSVDARGLRVRCPVPWLRRSMPLERMVGAGVVEEYAGLWGRGTIRTRGDGRTGLFVRSGPALEVLLVDGTVFAVTVDGADEAAGVVNALVDRRDATRAAPDMR